VWPQTWGLRARLLACVALLAAQRVLNLAVPVLYKRLVDKLGEAAAAAGAGDAEALWQVLSPWTLLYLGAIFFQGEVPPLGPRPRAAGAGPGLLGLLGLLRLLGPLGLPASQVTTAPDPPARPWRGLRPSPAPRPHPSPPCAAGGVGGGVTGLVSNLRSWLWVPVGQDSYRRISLRLLAHLLDLDLHFHLRRKTGEVRAGGPGPGPLHEVLGEALHCQAPAAALGSGRRQSLQKVKVFFCLLLPAAAAGAATVGPCCVRRCTCPLPQLPPPPPSSSTRTHAAQVTRVVDRGTSAMQNVLSTVLFSIVPQLFDVLAASTYLASALEPWIALVVFVTVGTGRRWALGSGRWALGAGLLEKTRLSSTCARLQRPAAAQQGGSRHSPAPPTAALHPPPAGRLVRAAHNRRHRVARRVPARDEPHGQREERARHRRAAQLRDRQALHRRGPRAGRVRRRHQRVPGRGVRLHGVRRVPLGRGVGGGVGLGWGLGWSGWGWGWGWPVGGCVCVASITR
jgi:hypothetical protein